MFDRAAFLIFLMPAFLHTVKRVEALRCVRQLDSCSCETDVDGWILDLSPLDNQKHNRNLFHAAGNDRNYTYIILIDYIPRIR